MDQQGDSGEKHQVDEGQSNASNNADISVSDVNAIATTTAVTINDKGKGSSNEEGVQGGSSMDVKATAKSIQETSEGTEPEMENNSAGQEKSDKGSEGKTSEATKEAPDDKGNVEVDEMDSGLSAENNPEQQSGDKMERRTSKRQRTSFTLSRFEPGEGGGLQSKKSKMNNNSGPDENGDGKDATMASTDDAGIDTQGEKGTDEGTKRIEWSEPRYQWTDEGVPSNRTSSVEHQGLEIDFSKSKTANWTPPAKFVVKPGDVVLISSDDDAPWNDPKQQVAQGSTKQQSDGESVPIYNDPASSEAGLGALDPYIGYVERLWEEVDESSKKGSGRGKKKGKSAKASTPKSSRMMIRTRWFFKKEDLQGLNGSFILEGGSNNDSGGNVKDEILANMSSHDLILSDESDDNAVSTILGKVKVVKRKPLDQSDDVDMTCPKGVYVCRYTLSFASDSSEDEGVVKLFPCNDEADFTVGKSAKDNDSMDPTSTDDDFDASAKQGTNAYDPHLSSLPFPLSPRRLVSEGATTVGKIKVGPDHQAEIPPQLDLERKTSFRGLAHPPSQRIPTMVWDPATDDDDAVDKFLEEACSLLGNHLKTMDLELFHDMNFVECPNVEAEAKKPREVNIDCLLTELHECKGDAAKAMKKISGNPEKYMTIWDKQEKEQFDNGYRIYRESIRMIAETSLGDSKSCKDTVDYQYRFKLIENFRRFKMKKRVKAEEMMATVEDRMMNEKVKAEAKSQRAVETDVSSSEEEDGKPAALTNVNQESSMTAIPAAHSGPVNNRIRTWFRTGGGDEDGEGATQQRRNRCCDLLTQVREKVGKDAYLTLAKSLKACNSSHASSASLADVKTTAKDVMKTHPDLLEQFMNFLPKEVRSN